MKLLIVAQAVSSEHPALGFFVAWISELAKHVERIEVICLLEGQHTLPSNVRVHSLGKERGAASRVTYAFRFVELVWRLRHDYDVVFVHMNQEYILLAGWFWRLWGKRVYLWRNHYAGSVLTDLAASFCKNVFCTSAHSYTARYPQTVLMPVGIDANRFTPDARIVRVPHSILFLARMAPSKRPELLIDALAQITVPFTAHIVGSPLTQDESYYVALKEKVANAGLSERVTFSPSVPNSATPDLYRSHEFFINTSPSGMLDKTIYEALACGALPLASSEDWALQGGSDVSFSDAETLARRLATLLVCSRDEIDARVRALHEVSAAQSLTKLGEALLKAMR